MKFLLTAVAITFVLVAGTLAVFHFREVPKYYGNLNEHVTILRDGYNLPALKQVKDLDIIAEMKCKDMIDRKYYAHVNPNGKQVWEQYEFGDYQWKGENLAHGFRSAMETVEGWKASKTHLDNILNPNYTEVGYGVCKDNNDYYYVVQVFRG